MEKSKKDSLAWKTLSSEVIISRPPWLTLRQDRVQLPDGRVNPEFYVLEYPDWVNVIAITDDGKFVMERQYRQGLGETCVEICAGARRDRVCGRHVAQADDDIGQSEHDRQPDALFCGGGSA